MEKQLNQNIFIQTGIAHTSRRVGGLLSIDYEGPHWEVDQTFFPLAIKFASAEEMAARPYLIFGGSIGFLARKAYYPDLNAGDTEPVDFKKAEFDGIAGVGLNFQNGDKNIFYLELTFRSSIHDITDNKDEHKLRVNSFDLIHFGVLFGVGKNSK